MLLLSGTGGNSRAFTDPDLHWTTLQNLLPCSIWQVWLAVIKVQSSFSVFWHIRAFQSRSEAEQIHLKIRDQKSIPVNYRKMNQMCGFSSKTVSELNVMAHTLFSCHISPVCDNFIGIV